jgi:hypothetical protein
MKPSGYSFCSQKGSSALVTNYIPIKIVNETSKIFEIILKQIAISACCLLHAGFFLAVFFDPEYGGNMLLRNAS